MQRRKAVIVLGALTRSVEVGAADAIGAVALGALCALLELPEQAVLDAFIYTSSRDLLSAAVRLNLIGPLAAVSLYRCGHARFSLRMPITSHLGEGRSYLV